MDALDVLSRESLYLAFNWRALVVNDRTLSVRTRHIAMWLRDNLEHPKTNKNGDLVALNVGLIAHEMVEHQHDVLQALLELEDAGWLVIRGDVRFRPAYLLTVPEYVQ